MASHSPTRKKKPIPWPQGSGRHSPCFPQRWYLEPLSPSLPHSNTMGPSFLEIVRASPQCGTLLPAFHHNLLAPSPFLQTSTPHLVNAYHPSERSSYITSSRKPSWIPQTRSTPVCLYYPCSSMSLSCPYSNCDSLFKFVIKSLIVPFSIKCQFCEKSHHTYLAFLQLCV